MLFALTRHPQCTLLSDKDDPALQLCASLLETQLNLQVAPTWDRASSRVLFMPFERLADDAPHAFPIVVLDDPPQADVLGYHDTVSAPVFVRPILYGSSVLEGDYALSQTICHEGIEAFGNRYINCWYDRDGDDQLCAELCDPVEHDPLRVTVSGQSLLGSNFVLPSYFDFAFPSPDGPCDFMGTLSAPGTISAGGYQIVRSRHDGQERYVYGLHYPDWKRELKQSYGRRARMGGV